MGSHFFRGYEIRKEHFVFFRRYTSQFYSFTVFVHLEKSTAFPCTQIKAGEHVFISSGLRFQFVLLIINFDESDIIGIKTSEGSDC